MTNQTRNDVLLEGIPVGAPEPSHENHGQLFYRQILEVPRLSGTADRLPLLVRQTQLPLLKEGVPLRVEGQLRSFNNRSGPGRRLVLTVYARSLQPGLGEPVNRILLAGTLCKPPIYRRTPLGRSISDLILAVPRSYGRADYLPVIAWGQVASQVCTLEAGAPLSLEGRVQSRIYRKVTETGPEERTAYEVRRHAVRRLKIDNAWTYAIAAGIVVQFIVLLAGILVTGAKINLILMIVGTVLGGVVGYLCQILFFSVDYSRTEYVQYEDDEYYYYVKAVPKINIVNAEVKVKQINARKTKKAHDISDMTSSEQDDENI